VPGPSGDRRQQGGGRGEGAYDGAMSTASAASGRRALSILLCAAALALSGCGALDGLLPGGAGASERGPSSTGSAPRAAEPSLAPDPDAALERERALAELLKERAAAVVARDRARFAALLDDPRSAFGARQLDLFANLTQLPLGTFSYPHAEPAPALGEDRARQVGPQAWVARVTGSYTLAGFDRMPRLFETHLTVVHRPAGWRLADDADGGTQPQLWDLPGLRVVRGRHTLAVGNAPQAAMTAHLRHGDEAVARTNAIWRRPWGGRVVLVVPATVDQMAAQVGQSPGAVEQVAAVTDGPLDGAGLGGADRIVLNPAAFGRLQPTGRGVVIAHEVAHVAIRATTAGQVPLWLAEGMADYVGYSGLGLPRTQVAAALLADVRAGEGPSALPAAADFDPSRATIAPSYNAAWLAACLIADRHGEQGLVELYEEVARRTSEGRGMLAPEEATEQAFPAVLGVSEDAFTEEWVRYLRALSAQ
jgi:hypothetical protein